MDLLTGKTLNEDIIERTKQAVIEVLEPPDDPLTPPAYRRHVCGVLVQRLLTRVRERLS